MIKFLFSILLFFCLIAACSSREQVVACQSPEDSSLAVINDSLNAISASGYALKNSFYVQSSITDDTGLIIGEITDIETLESRKHFSSGIWLVLQSQSEPIIKSLNGSAKYNSSLPRASVEDEVRYFDSGDMQRAKLCQ